MDQHYSAPKVAWSLALAFAMAAAVGTLPCAAQNSPLDFVILHNAARAEVGVWPVAWDSTVAAYAQSYADQRRSDCQLVLSGGPYGENLFWGSAGRSWSAADAVGSWVAEEQFYDHAANSCAAGHVCGHFTQVAWSPTTAIGCARVVCDNGGGVFIICSYNPPGNVQGQSPY